MRKRTLLVLLAAGALITGGYLWAHETCEEVNTAPLLGASTNMNEPVNILPPENTTFTRAVSPENGSAEVENGVIRYTPDSGFTGTDSFAYLAKACSRCLDEQCCAEYIFIGSTVTVVVDPI